MKGLFVYQEGSISSYLQDDLGRTKEYLKKIGIETVEYNRGYQAPQMILIPDDDEKNAEIARLTAENQRLQEEAAEQKSIAAHEHATQMEWFRIACDYKAENAALRERLENAVELPRVECIKTLEWINRERLGDILFEWCVIYKNDDGWLVVEPCFSKEAAEARLAEIKGGKE